MWLSQPDQRYRSLTCILYLTPDDVKRDGGALKCFLGCSDSDTTGETASSVVGIEPKAGRLVLFSSTAILHEVLPSNRKNRFAVTAWFLNRPLE